MKNIISKLLNFIIAAKSSKSKVCTFHWKKRGKKKSLFYSKNKQIKERTGLVQTTLAINWIDMDTVHKVAYSHIS